MQAYIRSTTNYYINIFLYARQSFDTAGSSRYNWELLCCLCRFAPFILLPLKTGTDVKQTSCHQAVFAFSGAAVQGIVGTLPRAAASALRSIAPRFAGSMRFIRMMVEFRRLNSGVKPQKFNKRSFCLCCFYSNVWFLKTLHHLYRWYPSKGLPAGPLYIQTV